MHARNGRTFVSDAFVLLAVLYMVAALMQSLVPISLNRIFGSAIAVLLAYDYLTSFTKGGVFAICAVAVAALVSFGVTSSNYIDEIEFFVYWVACLLVLRYFSCPSNVRCVIDSVGHFGGLIAAVVVGAALVLVMLLVTHTGYESEWGGDDYFVGLCNTEHTMASVCCLVMSLAFVLSRNRKLPNLCVVLICLVSTWGLLQTGARTFLVPAAIIWFFFLRKSVKHRWFRVLLYFVIAIIVAVSFSSTGMAAKFNFLSMGTTDSAISSFTNGRNEYWATDLEAYSSGNPLTILLGNSASSVYELNSRMFGMRIWSHSDFVMTICSVGLIGFSVYLITLVNFFRSASRTTKRLELVSLVLFVLFPALLNGFYPYQHLIYAAVFFFSAIANCEERGAIEHSAHF